MATHKWWHSFIPIYGIYPILDTLFGKGKLDGLAGKVADSVKSLTNKYTGSGLTTAENEANAFSHNEAELAYQRQREFYSDFQSPQAMVQQYQQAGLNPALMYANGGSSPSAIGSSAPSSASPAGADLGQLISLIAGIGFRAKEVMADTKLKNAQSMEATARAENVRKENEVFGERFQIWKQVQNSTITNLGANTAYQLAQANLSRANISKVEAETAWTNAQTILTKIDARNRQAVIDSALAVNQANVAFITEQTAKTGSERRLVEQAYSQRMQKFEYELRQAAAEAGISEAEFNAFWTREKLNAVAIQAQAFSAAKSSTSVLFGLINHSGTNLVDFAGLNLAGSLTAPSAP